MDQLVSESKRFIYELIIFADQLPLRASMKPTISSYTYIVSIVTLLSNKLIWIPFSIMM